MIYSMPRLLREEIFSLPPLGTINLHPSLLPRYRGPNPYFWMYHDMTSEGGVTVHFVDAGEDTGDVIFQASFPIPAGRPARDHGRTLDGSGSEAARRGARCALARRLSETPQPREVPYPRARRIEPGEQRELIDWKAWPIERVWHVLRGSESWLRAFDGPPGWRRAFRWTTGSYERGPVAGEPASIGRDRQGFYVVHPEGKIRLAVLYDARALARAVLGRLGIR